MMKSSICGFQKVAKLADGGLEGMEDCQGLLWAKAGRAVPQFYLNSIGPNSDSWPHPGTGMLRSSVYG